MIVEIETVAFNTAPDDYIDGYEILDATVEYEINGDSVEDNTQYVKTDRLDALITHIGMGCIVHDTEGDIRRMDDANWVVRVYDDYNE